MLNHIVIQGRVVRDIELRHTQSGIPVCSFTIACDRDYKDANGNRETDFIDCSAWRSTADFVAQYFSKGKAILIDGRLQLRDWVDRDGNKRRSSEILVNSAHFADSKPQNQSASDVPAPSYAAAGVPSGGFAEMEDGGDLPF